MLARCVSLAAFVIVITHNGLLQRILPLCLTLKVKCLCSETHPSVDGKKEEINTAPSQRLAILGDICKIKYLFTLFHLPHLWSMKEPGIHTPNWKTLPIYIDWKCWQGIYSLSGLIPAVAFNTGGLCWHKDLIDWTVMLARLVISAHFAPFLNIHWFHTRGNKWLIKDLSHDWQPLLPGWEQKALSAREVLLTEFAPMLDSCPVSAPFSFCVFSA